jgi:hypothetical protein
MGLVAHTSARAHYVTEYDQFGVRTKSRKSKAPSACYTAPEAALPPIPALLAGCRLTGCLRGFEAHFRSVLHAHGGAPVARSWNYVVSGTPRLRYISRLHCMRKIYPFQPDMTEVVSASAFEARPKRAKPALEELQPERVHGGSTSTSTLLVLLACLSCSAVEPWVS